MPPCECDKLCTHPLCSDRCLMEAVPFCPTSTRRRILCTGRRVSPWPLTAMLLWPTLAITVLRCTITFSDWVLHTSISISCTSTADPSRLLSCANCCVLAGMDRCVLNNYRQWIFARSEACKIKVWSHLASMFCLGYMQEPIHIVHIYELFSFLKV